MTEITNDTNFKTSVASNVAKALENKTFSNGAKFDQNKSVFLINEDGKVSVDLDGDGNFDVTVNNVINKKGTKVDTDYKDYDIKENKDSTENIKNISKQLAELKVKENPDDENGLTKQIESKKAEIQGLQGQVAAKEQELETLKQNLEAADNKVPDEDDTRKSFRKARKAERKLIKEQIEKKEDEIKQLEQDIKAKENEVESMQKELDNIPKLRMKLNKKLQKLGYDKDDRKSLRENGTVISDMTGSIKNKVIEFKDNVLSVNEQIKNQAQSFIDKFNKSNPTQKIDVKDIIINDDGSIDIKSNDGDDRADFNISGIYDSENQKINFDDREIKIMGKQGSTSHVNFLQGKIDEYNKKGQEAIQNGDYAKASELFNKAAQIKIEMEQIGYTEKRFQE